MTPITEAELLAALSDNFLEIEKTAARVSSRINDDDWKLALDRIVRLRKVRRDLEAKLKAIKNNPPSGVQ